MVVFGGDGCDEGVGGGDYCVMDLGLFGFGEFVWYDGE